MKEGFIFGGRADWKTRYFYSLILTIPAIILLVLFARSFYKEGNNAIAIYYILSAAFYAAVIFSIKKFYEKSKT